MSEITPTGNVGQSVCAKCGEPDEVKTDLLKAAKLLLAHMHFPKPGSHSTRDAAVLTLDRVIRKAEGRS